MIGNVLGIRNLGEGIEYLVKLKGKSCPISVLPENIEKKSCEE